MMMIKESLNKNYLGSHKMSKREIVRKMYVRALRSGNSHYSISYIARRLSLSIEKTFYFLNWMSKHNGVTFVKYDHSITFVY